MAEVVAAVETAEVVAAVVTVAEEVDLGQLGVSADLLLSFPYIFSFFSYLVLCSMSSSCPRPMWKIHWDQDLILYAKIKNGEHACQLGRATAPRPQAAEWELLREGTSRVAL